MTDRNIDEAKRRLPLRSVMCMLGFGDRAKKSARCPFHDDSRASFSVYDGDAGLQSWKCWAGCGQGDAIDFLARARNIPNAEAVRQFKRLAGLAESQSRLPAAAALPARITPPVPFDWSGCVADLTEADISRLAVWRGYSPEFVAWLRSQEVIGLKDKAHIAVAVRSEHGAVVGCHYRLERDGSWRYHPTGVGQTPLIFGDLGAANAILAFESQWDAWAVMDRLGWHQAMPPDLAVLITRGATNGRVLSGRCAPGSVVMAFAQNDVDKGDGRIPPGLAWLRTVAASCGCECRHVTTPPTHKDPNDWTRAGASAEDIRAAMAAAQPVLLLDALDGQPSSETARMPQATVAPTPEDDPGIEDTALQPFPLELLPPTMASMVAATARSQRVPAVLPAIMALGAVSAAVGAGLEVVSGPNRRTRANLYLVAVAESGTGKSETFRIIAAPLQEHDAMLQEQWRRTTGPQAQAEIRALEKEIAATERRLVKAATEADRDRMVSENAFRIAKRADLERRSACPQIVVQDCTVEKLAVVLRDNRECAFSASSDARKLIENLLGRYNPGKTSDESLYLTSFSGDMVRVDRQGRDPVVLQQPCLVLCWAVQPDLLGVMFDHDSLSVSGFLPRVLVANTRAALQRIQDGDNPGIPEPIRDSWARLLQSLLATFRDASAPARIEPEPAALAALNDFHNRIVDRRLSDLADVGTFAARYAENAWRLSLVFHAAFHGADAGRHPLAAETARNAIAVIEWFVAQQLDILARSRRQAAEAKETEVLELLEKRRARHGVDHVNARDVHRARIMPTSQAAQALLKQMESDGLLRGEDVHREQGGRPTRIYRPVSGINPIPG
jgi:hypothetical protein